MSSPTGSWCEAWAAAAYGPDGFWLRADPAEHFRTASTTGPELAEALLSLLVGRPDLTRVVEIGAGNGRLLAALHQERPSLRLAGTDLRPRPAGLPPQVAWARDLWDVATGSWTTGGAERLLGELDGPVLLLAVEWLDDLPCRVAHRTAAGLAELDAALEPGAPLPDADLDWARVWWPEGDRVEVGGTRDQAWAWLVRALAGTGGLALMVDYGHERCTRPPHGSLAGYRAGRSVPPAPVPDRDVTAHVAVDAVEAAGRQAGARTIFRRRQADVLADLVPVAEASAGTVAGLAAGSRRAALRSLGGWGAHWWLLQEVASPL